MLQRTFSAVQVNIADLPTKYHARAFTDGKDINISPRYVYSETCISRWLIAHELAHIIQQQQHRVSSEAVANEVV